MRALGDRLDRCIRGKLEPEYDETAEYVLQAIHFRRGYVELVDEIVMQLDLPMPSEQNMRKLGSNSLERRHQHQTARLRRACFELSYQALKEGLPSLPTRIAISRRLPPPFYLPLGSPC